MKKEQRMSHEERHQRRVDEYNERTRELNQRLWLERTFIRCKVPVDMFSAYNKDFQVKV